MNDTKHLSHQRISFAPTAGAAIHAPSLLDSARGLSISRLISHVVATHAQPAVILIRILVGWVFLAEGIGKFLYPAEQAAGRFATIPAIPAPHFFGPFVGGVEIVFGLMVVLGLFTRLAALVLLLDISVAIVTTKFPILAGQHYGLPVLKHYNLWGMLHEARTDFSMWLGCLFLLIVGAGSWSLDAKLFSSSRAR